MPYYPMMGWYPYMGFWMSIVWLIIVIGIAYLLYRLIKGERLLSPQAPPGRSAEDILAERYAKGELTREQYLQMRDDLKRMPPE